jgi:iron complex transport system substrate-binding protein
MLIVSACGGDGESNAESSSSSPAPAATDAGFPAVVREVIIPEPPSRIVSASATHTEILYAIGAGADIVATDSFSTYPAAAAETEKIDAFNPSVEAISALDPDLVLLAFDPGDLVAALETVGIPALLFDPAVDLDDAFRQITDLGAATGRSAAAADLVTEMQRDISEIVDGLPDGGVRATYFHELDPTLYTVTSETFIGGLYAMLGLENIADPAAVDGYQYPQLTAEFVLDADPGFVFLADTVCCGESAATVAARPGWNSLTAVREGRVVELDDDVASRWGPRLVDFLRIVAEAVHGPGGAG